MFSKSSLFVFLTVAFSASSALAGASAGPNGNAHVGRRFVSDESDSSGYDRTPDCTPRIINARGVKKVIRNKSGLCREADDLRTDEDETIKDTGNTGGTFVDDDVDDTERKEFVEEEGERLLPEDEEDDDVETSQPNGSDDDEEDGYASYDDPDEDEYDGPGRDQGI